MTIPQDQKDLRATGMLNLYNEGFTLQEIGEKWNISRERVRQILVSIDAYESRPRGTRKGHKRYVATVDERDKIIQLARVNMSVTKISRELGISNHYIRPVIQEEFSEQDYKEYVRLIKQSNGVAAGAKGVRFTEDDFVSALLTASLELGDNFGVSRYDNWRKEQLDSENYPSGVLFTQTKDHRVSGWNNLRKLAGLPISEKITSEKMGIKKFTDEDLLLAVKRVCDNNPDVSFPSLGLAQKEMTSPSVHAVRVRIGSGSWRKVEEAYNRWNNNN